MSHSLQTTQKTLRTLLIMTSLVLGLGQISQDQSNFPEKISLKTALEQIPSQQGDLFAQLFQNEAIDIYLYTPIKEDQQKPHGRDEVYIVLKGKGVLVRQGKKLPFEDGDILFVKAGVDHHFEDLAKDFKTYVIFFGKESGG